MKWILGSKYFTAKIVKLTDIVIHPKTKKGLPVRMVVKAYKLVQINHTSSESFEN